MPFWVNAWTKSVTHCCTLQGKGNTKKGMACALMVTVEGIIPSMWQKVWGLTIRNPYGTQVIFEIKLEGGCLA